MTAKREHLNLLSVLPTVNMEAFPSLESNPSAQGAFKLDEGYSEETRSQEGDTISLPVSRIASQACELSSTVPEWVTGMNEAQRMGIFFFFFLGRIYGDSAANIKFFSRSCLPSSSNSSLFSNICRYRSTSTFTLSRSRTKISR